MPMRMSTTSCSRLLLYALYAVCVLHQVSSTGVMRAGLGLGSEISLSLLDQLWNNRADLVTYAKCDASMCPPLEPPCKKPECPKVELQKTKEPPPKAYECRCDDPNEVPECGCLNECCAQRKKEYEAEMACQCRLSMSVPSRAVTHVVDPHAKPPPPPKNEKRKFLPRQTDPNPLPPIKEVECRPNVHGISPGNCRRGNSMGTCQSEQSQCKDIKSASKGFIAATLSDEVQPDDMEEDCTHEGTVEDATAYSELNANGDQAKAHASVYNRCTQKSRYVSAADIFVHPPTVIRRNGDPVPLSDSDDDPAPRSGPLASTSGSSDAPGASSASTVSQSLSSLLSTLSSSLAANSNSNSLSASGSSAAKSAASSASASQSGSQSVTLSKQSLQSIISQAVQSALSQSASAKSSSSSSSSSGSSGGAPLVASSSSK